MNFNEYEKVSLGVDCVIMSTDTHIEDNCRMEARRALQVLLIKRNIEPFNGYWSIPGGLVDFDKGLTETINTKLFKKVNLGDVYKEQLYTYGDDVNRDPRGRVVSVAYLAMAAKEKLAEIHDTGYGEVKWFWVALNKDNNIVIRDPSGFETDIKLAFDHKKIIEDAVLRMRGKVMYTDIAFQMVPDKFTMRELQDVYECILGKPIYSFRRVIGDKVRDTNEFSAIKAHRPAKLFEYNKESEK